MAKKANKKAFRVYFSKGIGDQFEVHARKVENSSLFGFVELSEFIQPRKSGVIIEPGSDRVEREFEGVNRTYIPIKDVIRIDEYETESGSDEGNLRVIEFRKGSSSTGGKQ